MCIRVSPNLPEAPSRHRQYGVRFVSFRPNLFLPSSTPWSIILTCLRWLTDSFHMPILFFVGWFASFRRKRDRKEATNARYETHVFPTVPTSFVSFVSFFRQKKKGADSREPLVGTTNGWFVACETPPSKEKLIALRSVCRLANIIIDNDDNNRPHQQTNDTRHLVSPTQHKYKGAHNPSKP